MNLTDFSMRNKTGAITVKGIKQGDKYVATISVAGQESKKLLTYPQELLDDFFRVELAAINNSLAVGDFFIKNTFESLPPRTGQSPTEHTVESIEKMMINGVSSDVYKLKMFLPDENVTGSLIVDQAGNNLSWDMGTGLTIKLESKEQAMKLDESFDVLDATLIKVSQPIDDPTKLKSANFRVTGVDDIEFIEMDYQHVEKTDNGFILSINRPTVPEMTYSIPVNLDEMTEYLKPEVFIQSDSKEIVDLVKQIVGSKTNSYRAALTINSWVYNNIEKVYTPDISNALQTLQNGQGDCGEHAVLAVALCRAAGIPARSVTGIIYCPPGNGFGYHAWVEVYVGEWIAMDPSWNESETNPTHIALAIGDVVDQSVILTKVMGRMQIEVLAVE